MNESPQNLNPERSGIRRFLRFSMIYALGDALAKGARVVLIPYYLSVLSQSEVGELAVVQAVIFFSWTFLAFGLGFAVRRYYYEYQEHGLGDCFASSLWTARWIGGLPVFGLLLLIGWFLPSWSDGAIDRHLILLAITAGFLKGGLNVVEFWLNIREEPVKYRAFTFGQFLLTTLLIVYFVTFQSLGVMGVVMGEVVSYTIFLFVSAFLLFSKSKPKRSVIRWKEIGAYCIPVLPHALFMWGLMGLDRLILNEYVDKAEIGVYEIGYLLGSFLSIVVRSMRAAWIPAYFRGAKEQGSKRQFAKTAVIYFVCTYWAGMLGLLLAPEVIWLFSLTSTANYVQSVNVMQIVLFGFVAMAVFLAMNQKLLYEEKTTTLACISGFGLAVNFCANLLLIPNWGIHGAAYATVIAYAAIVILTLVTMRKSLASQLETREQAVLLSLFLVFGFTSFIFPDVPVVWVLPAKLAIFALFVVMTLFRLDSTDGSQIKIRFRFQN